MIRIHHYGIKKFGVKQADKYFSSFFDYFEIIAERPLSFEAVDFIKPSYRRCACGVDTIYFRLSGNIAEIIAMIGRQDLNQLKE